VAAHRDQASITGSVAAALALMTLGGGAAMLMLRSQGVGVGFMALYAGATLFAVFVLVRSEAGVAARLMLVPLLLGSNFLLVLSGDPLRYRATQGALGAVAAAPDPQPSDLAGDPDAASPAPAPTTIAEVIASAQARTADMGEGGVSVRMVPAGGDTGDAIDWWVEVNGEERPCGRITLWGEDRAEQATLVADTVARARRASREEPSCGDGEDAENP
jgi:hypothetical protein